MSRRTRSLNKNDLEKYLMFEGIPSGSDLDFSDED